AVLVAGEDHGARVLGGGDQCLGHRVRLLGQPELRDLRAVLGDGDGPDAVSGPLRRRDVRVGGRGGPAVLFAPRAGVGEVEERVEAGVQLVQVKIRYEGNDAVDDPAAGGEQGGLEDDRVDAVHAVQRPGVEQH